MYVKTKKIGIFAPILAEIVAETEFETFAETEFETFAETFF